MLTGMRSAIVALLEASFTSPPRASQVDVYGRVPDDVNALPCMVVGYPSATPAAEAAVFDRAATVYVIARRPDVDDAEGELVALTDEAFDVLGGTRGVRSLDGLIHLSVEGVAHRVVQIAGLDHDAYLLTIESPIATC